MLARTVRMTGVPIAALLLVSALWVGVASAGGGCHEGVTQGEGDTIVIADACFTPTTLYVEPGDQVTWLNKDDYAHNVTANTWGYFDDLNEGDTFTATFDQDGVYPFACTYHPGMTGAIVVGDGVGTGSGDSVEQELVSSFEEESPQPAVAASRPESSSSSSTAGWWIGGAIGLLVGAAGAFVLTRRRGSSSLG
jgi:plastocyanin